MTTKGGVIRQPLMRPPAEANTGTLLLYAYKNFDRQLFASLLRAGHDGMRGRHGALLANLDEGGTRLSTLARRADIGASAMGELVDELERLGYVERRPDPSDRRAKLIVATTRGARVIERAARTIREIEARYARLLGKRGHVALRDALTRLAESPTADGTRSRVPSARSKRRPARGPPAEPLA